MTNLSHNMTNFIYFKDKNDPHRTVFRKFEIIIDTISAYRMVTLLAWRPFGPRSTLNSTSCPSFKVRNPFP